MVCCVCVLRKLLSFCVVSVCLCHVPLPNNIYMCVPLFFLGNHTKKEGRKEGGVPQRFFMINLLLLLFPEWVGDENKKTKDCKEEPIGGGICCCCCCYWHLYSSFHHDLVVVIVIVVVIHQEQLYVTVLSLLLYLYWLLLPFSLLLHFML